MTDSGLPARNWNITALPSDFRYMKVQINIFEQLVPLSGGGTPRTFHLIKAFLKRGHQVYVASSVQVSRSTALRTLGCQDLKPLKNVSRLSKYKMLKYLYSHPLNIVNTTLFSGEIEPDLILSHNTIAGFSGLLAREVSFKPFVVLDLTDLLFEYLQDFKSVGWLSAVQKIGSRMEARTIRESDLIITISQAMKEILERVGAAKEKISVVYDGVDLATFVESESGDLRERYGRGMKNIIIFHGVIDPQDGPELLIEASRMILQKFPETMFWVIGDGSALPGMKLAVAANDLKDHYFFSGWIHQHEVPAFISASDMGLVILPDVLSARGRVTLKEFEYWACGIPAVLPRLPALEEVVEEGKNGLFYQAGHAEDMAEKVCSLLEDKNRMQSMGRYGKKIVSEKFNWENLALEIVRICEERFSDFRGQ